MTFVRQSTGLVREISGFEAFAFNLGGAGPLVFTLAFTAFFLLYAAPGVDIVLVMIIGGLMSLGTTISYGLLSASMPRSGGEYVFVSRILRPEIAFTSEIVQYFVQAAGFATVPSLYVVFWGLAPTLYQMGLITGNSSLLDLAGTISTPIWATVIGTMYLAFVFFASVLGVRVTFRYLVKLSFFISIIAFAAMMGVLLVNTPESSIMAFDSFMGQYGESSNASQTILQNYVSLGYKIPVSYDPMATFIAAGFTLFAGIYHWSSFHSGEIKHAGRLKSQVLQMSGSLIVGVLLVALLAGLILRNYGYDLVRALTALSLDSPDSIPGAAFSLGAVTNYLIFILTSSVPLLILFFVGLLTMGFILAAVFVGILSRLAFAMSFDRVLPMWLSDVSERFHTPVKSLLLGFGVTWVFMLLYLWTPYLQTLILALGFMGAIPILLTCLSTVIFPFRRKEIFSASPVRNWTPVLVVAGLLGMLYALLALYVFLTNPIFAFGDAPKTVTLVLYVVAFVSFLVIRALRKRSGIDLSLAYKEIPPE